MLSWNWVEPKILAAGSIPFDADHIRELHGHGIRSILSLVELPLTDRPNTNSQFLARLGIDYYHVPIPDNFPPDEQQAEDILSYIREMKTAGNPLYFHCFAGIGRTGTVMHLYFLAQGLPLDQAEARVRLARPQCDLTTPQRLFVQHYAEKLAKRGATIV